MRCCCLRSRNSRRRDFRPLPRRNDHRVIFVVTSHDASKLPPEFARAERFDGVFFVDLPGRDQKDRIWGIDTRHYGLDAKQARPDDANRTGAEIKSCCRLASLLDVPLVQAAQNVVRSDRENLRPRQADFSRRRSSSPSEPSTRAKTLPRLFGSISGTGLARRKPPPTWLTLDGAHVDL